MVAVAKPRAVPAAVEVVVETGVGLGLGEAGSAIIKNNLDGDDEGLNAMVPGTKMMGYFGFCDVRSFTELTECLEHEVFVRRHPSPRRQPSALQRPLNRHAPDPSSTSTCSAKLCMRRW